MTNMLSEGSAWLVGQLVDNASDPVTYSRAPITLTCSAMKGTTSFDSEQADGSMIRFESLDYIFKASEFVPLLGLPQGGDLIYDGTHIYEVLAINGSQPFRYSDRHRTLIRIHTKQIG